MSRTLTPINFRILENFNYYPIINKVDGYLDEHFLLISQMCVPYNNYIEDLTSMAAFVTLNVVHEC